MAFRFPFIPRRPRAGHEDRRWHITKRISVPRSLRVPVLIFAAAFLYVAANFVVNHYNPVQTVRATQYSMDDSFSVSGWFFRNEEVIDIAQGDTVEYNYSNGDKVGVNAALVTQYSSEQALETSRRLETIKSSISQLEALQTGNASSMKSNQIDKRIITQINGIMQESESGSLTQISSLCSELRQLALKSDTTITGSKDIAKELQQLRGQAEELEAGLEGQTSSTMSDKAGYFCDSIDGWEEDLTSKAVQELNSVEQLDKLTQGRHRSKAGKGKLIVGFYWYFVAPISDEDAARLTKGSTVRLRFAKLSEDVRAEVYALTPDEEAGKTLAVFRSDVWNEHLVSMRDEVAEVVIDTYDGIKVPKEAVRMKDDTMGVYVLVNTVSTYKTIDPLYEGTDFYVVRKKVIGDASLVVGDDIIVQAKDLDDKKVVK